MALAWKAGTVQAVVGSNPTLSALVGCGRALSRARFFLPAIAGGRGLPSGPPRPHQKEAGMDNPHDMAGGQVSPEEAMRQLIQLRQQLGQARFSTVARQMGMPDELLDHIEQAVAAPGGAEEAAAPAAGSGLLDASGRPLGGGPSGLVDVSGRPIQSAPSLDGARSLNGAAADDEDLEEVTSTRSPAGACSRSWSACA